MAAQPPSKELEQSEQAPASLPQADQVPAKRKATEELQHSRRPPTQPGTLPFIWNLPTTPSLPIFYADATLVPSDDEYDSEDELELESDEVVDELAKTKQQLYEAKKKIAALAKRLRMYQVTVLPMDYKLVDEPVKEPVKEKSAIEREADALRVFSLKQWEEHLKSEDEKGNEYDKIEDYRAVFEDVEWAVHEHHRLVHLALGELRKGRTGPAGSIDDYKPGQLPMYILDNEVRIHRIQQAGYKFIMSRQPPESCGHGSVSQVATDSASAIEIFEPDEDMVEADQDPVYYEIDGSRFYEACVRDKPRRELPSLLVAQPNQPVSPQSDLKGPSASSPHGIENWKPREKLARTEERLEEQATELVRRRSRELNRYIGYVQAIHHRMEDDGDTICSLRRKLMAAGIKYEDWKGIDALLMNLEDSCERSSEDIINVAFEFQKDIDRVD
ncbi:unnamed protein product [Sordaria macrospora k-hell]|uniref:WGS project CABT00000000 data, contig 2.32 n=1 Tax=Sordaria macrospora (strain ATCC MYA-333 / DSM 997 / K(L3346) / K-hell) TaxID=771870 RepID=F7W627_SORMK|nr:uncharacterized protein SMAC_06107 [Sordaria macrospora k-hell]CCC12965.1 unnamed protein product [Sordaria macrospora k-hell]